MKILMLNWKDLRNPTAGGAEVLTEGILRELARRGHDITLFVCQFPGGREREVVDGYTVMRKGKYWTVQFWAMAAWFSGLHREKFDVVIDQIHGIPFFTSLYMPRQKKFAFIHEVAGDIWFSMFPFPVSLLGWLVERAYFLLYYWTNFLTVSNSTLEDLLRVGIPKHRIALVPEAVDDANFFPATVGVKSQKPSVLYVGRIAPMKQINRLLEAAEKVRKHVPDLQVWIVGGGEPSYVDGLKRDYPKAEFFGRVSDEKKRQLLSEAWILSSASLKEGFGLVIIEAACAGTTSVVYNVHGFRDAVVDGETGLLCRENTPESLGESITRVLLDPVLREKLSAGAKEYSKNFTFARAATEFEQKITPPF